MHFIKSIIFAAAAFGLTQAVQPEDERLTQAIYARDALAEALDGDADDFVLYARTIEANKAKRALTRREKGGECMHVSCSSMEDCVHADCHNGCNTNGKCNIPMITSKGRSRSSSPSGSKGGSRSRSSSPSGGRHHG